LECLQIPTALKEITSAFLRSFAVDAAYNAEKMAHIHRKRCGDYELHSLATGLDEFPVA
jgi:hypothetical protein